MKRWNGWGEETVEYPLHDDALAFLASRIGPGKAVHDASFDAACASLAESRLPAHALVDTRPATRLRNALGQSLPD